MSSHAKAAIEIYQSGATVTNCKIRRESDEDMAVWIDECAEGVRIENCRIVNADSEV